MIAALTVAGRILGSRLALGALLAAAALIIITFYGNTRWRAGYDAYRLDMLHQAAELERGRIEDETRLQGLSDYDLCADYLGSRGLSVEPCDGLRGVPGERP